MMAGNRDMSTLALERPQTGPPKDAGGKWRPGSVGNPWGRAGRPDGWSASAQRRSIREKLAEIGSVPVDRVCARCLACLSLDAPDVCPRCGGAVLAAPDGVTRETLFLDALWNRAIENPDGPAARLLMEYGYGRVPLAPRHAGGTETGTSKTRITLRVIEAPMGDGQPMPQLLEKPLP